MSNIAEHLSNEVASTTCWVVANGVAVTLWPPDGPTPHSPDQRRPILYLVAPGGPEPPVVGDDLADWVQLPSDAEEVQERARRLMARARASGTVLAYVDADDVLRVGDRLAVLSPIEARIMRILLDHAGSVVSRTHINQEIWPAKAPDDFSILNNRVKLLRDHISRLPFRIHTVRHRGLLLEVTPSSKRLSPDISRSLGSPGETRRAPGEQQLH